MDYNQYYLNILKLLRVRCYQKFGTQKALAQRLGIDSGNLSKILTGVIKPTAILFVTICSELDYTLCLTINPLEL